MCVDVSLENRCKRAQMANFLLARALGPALAVKSSIYARERRAIKRRRYFVARIETKRSTEYVIETL